MRFAKDCFDVGLMVPADRFDLSQWNAIPGLHLDHVLDIASYQQHRFHCGDAVLKVNVGQVSPDPDSPTGLVAFRVGASRAKRQQESQVQHGSPPTGRSQFNVFATNLAAVVFPHPRGPEKR